MAQSGKKDGKTVRTITDLARLAGVSPGTVSRALAGKSLVNHKTRDRIQKLAREHDFRLNQMASRLRRQKTGAIGIIIPMDDAQRQQISDTFYMQLMACLADELTDRGYDLMLRRVIPDRDPDWLDRFIGSGMVDGTFIIGQSNQFERIEQVAKDYLPMVAWGNYEAGQHHCAVGTDNRLGGELAASQLIAGGAQRITFIGNTDLKEFAARLAGAQEIAKRRNVPIEVLKIGSALDRLSGEIAAHLANAPDGIDAIFAASDTVALACLRELRRQEIAIPGQIRLIGFDDLPISSYVEPALTTIHQDPVAGGKGMIDLLMRRLAGEETQSLIMPPKLIVRETA